MFLKIKWMYEIPIFQYTTKSDYCFVTIEKLVAINII